jgi:hypothetical protein
MIFKVVAVQDSVSHRCKVWIAYSRFNLIQLALFRCHPGFQIDQFFFRICQPFVPTHCGLNPRMNRYWCPG